MIGAVLGLAVTACAGPAGARAAPATAPSSAAEATRAVEPGRSGVALAEQPSFRIELGPPTPCAHASACEVRLLLTARGGYKVNEAYPFKFVGDASTDAELDGTGTFTVDDHGRGTMTIRLRAARAGTLRLSGRFKLSVCTEDQCAIEAPQIAFDVDVT